MSNFKILSLLLLPFWCFIHSENNQNNGKIIEHTVLISHPGEKGPTEVVLSEKQNANGLPIEYSMDVRSVICLEEVCKVIPVKLYWNTIGEYSKYELEKGATLEKYEADVFTPQDYIKLNTILSNTNSPFKEVYIDEILTVPDELNEDVDAVSGATALELDEKDTVPGAALTCFTLWHWANGDVISKIKETTKVSVTNEHLLDFISNKNETYFNLGLQSLITRELYTSRYIDTIYNRILKNNKLLKPALVYLDTAPLDIYLNTLQKLLKIGDKEQKLAAIRSLNTSHKNIPKSFLNNVSSEFSNLKSFHEVSILLELMQTKNPNSQTVIKNVFPLLDGDFIPARRAYWYLKNEKLTPPQTKRLQLFYENNKNKL